jgi:putative salt-induced outer membrane protein
MAHSDRADFILKRLVCIGVLSVLTPVVANADAAPPAPPPPPPPEGVWTGQGQLGFVQDQGNTNSKTANAMLDMGLVETPWKHTLHLEGLYGQSSGFTAAERWAALWQTNYTISGPLFTFGALNYDYDLFSGFEYQRSITAGMGYAFFNSNTTKLSVQLGAGYNMLRPEELTKNASGVVIGRVFEPRASDAIATAGVNYSQALTATTTLSDKLLVNAGSLNTLLTNALALTVKMTTKLALSLGYSLQENTKPPAGLKKLDTIETVNIVYGF